MKGGERASPPKRRTPGRADPLFAHGGEMGALMRSTDWSKTALGPAEKWPKSLRTMLGVVLGSRFPMLLWWGPDLLHLYNDAYRPILRDKHPASLAAPAAKVWAEVWDVAGPMARGVLDGGPATWTEDLRLFISSGDMAEETYFTFSYSPVPGDDGRIGGLLNTVQETTATVQSERQIRMRHDLAARAAEARSEDEACRTAVEVLSANEADLPFVSLYILDEEAGGARLAAAGGWGAYEGPAKPALAPVRTGAGPGSWPFSEAVRTAREVVVDGLSARFGPLPAGRWNARPERAVVLPLFQAGRPLPRAFLVAGVSPHRALNDRYRRFFQAVADQVSNVLANARAYEAEKKRAEALAEIDRAKTVFFSNVSHEFRTPLTLILGPVEDALAGAAKSLAGEDLQAVHRNAVRLLRLVNSLLDFARIEAGRLPVTFVPTDLARLTAGLASAFHSLTERAGLKLVVDCPPLPAPVYVDPGQWEKIVLNLVSNAFKFTLKGEISVSLRAAGDRVALTVRDTGGGIPERELPRIFERFHRVEGAAGRSFEGTGIGLSLVQELARLHGGTVDVTSVEGQGSAFRVSIPAGSAHLPADRVASAGGEAPGTAGAAPYLMEAAQWIGTSPAGDGGGPVEDDAFPPPAAAAPSAGRARLLVVDDNADMRAYLARLLSARWDVETAADGVEALPLARRRRPDLVLSDVMMPRMDGFALLRALRAEPDTRDTPVLLLSARAGEEPLLEGLETGADDYLVKPFSARELVARVRTHLDMARRRRTWAGELEQANKELEAFSYSVSHDLRAPLRSIDGFSKILLEDAADKLDEDGRRNLERVCAAARHMAGLIDDMLNLSRLTSKEMTRETVDLSALAGEVVQELRKSEPERSVEVQIADGLSARGDAGLLRILLQNLLGNAWKFTGKRTGARIAFLAQGAEDGKTVFCVRDNGAGFDMAYAQKLFGAFQRLHTASEFPGTGIGLATVQRVARRHGGRVWAEGKTGEGAAFYFTL